MTDQTGGDPPPKSPAAARSRSSPIPRRQNHPDRASAAAGGDIQLAANVRAKGERRRTRPTDEHRAERGISVVTSS